MSILLDDMAVNTPQDHYSTCRQQINSLWYIAKPEPSHSCKAIILRISDAIRVLKGKSFAVHYKIDE